MFEISILLMILIFMFGAFIKGWSGFGTNLVVPPLLLFLSRFENSREVMVIVISVNLFINLIMIIKSKRFNLSLLKEIWVLVVFALAFNFLGSYLFNTVDDSLFRILLGIMILLVTANRLFKLNFQIDNPKKYYIPTGIVSGILNGMFGLGGIPLLILFSTSKMDKEKFRSMLVTYFFILNLLFIISTGVIGGYYNVFVFTNILYVIVFAIIAALYGMYLSSKVSDKMFQRVMNGVLIFFGTNLIYSGIFGQHIFMLFS